MYKIAAVLFEHDTIPNFPEVCTCWDAASFNVDLFLFGQSSYTSAVPTYVAAVHHFPFTSECQMWDMTPYAAALCSLLPIGDYDAIVMNATRCTNTLAPLLGEMLGSDCLSDISSFSFEIDGIVVRKPLFSMNLTGNYRLRGRCPVLTIISNGALHEKDFISVERIETHAIPQQPQLWFSDLVEERLSEYEAFGTKKRLVAAGRGLNREQFEKAGRVAELLDAELGSTRALVQQGIAPTRTLIGISGTLVRPEKCLILGASGAAPFAIGVEKSKTIFGVNTEPMAPLFSFCDYGLVCDADALLDALLQQLQTEGNNEEVTL